MKAMMIISFLFAAFFLAACATQDNGIPAAKTNACVQIGGQWDGNYNECLGISQTQCESINGTFDDCASACRHNPDAAVCTLQCVQLCTLP